MKKKIYEQWRKDILPYSILKAEKTNFGNPEKIRRNSSFNISKSVYNNRGKRYISPDTKQKFSIGDFISFIPGRQNNAISKRKIICQGRIERFIESRERKDKDSQIFIVLSQFETFPQIKSKSYCIFNFSRIKNPSNVSKYIFSKVPQEFILNFASIEKPTPRKLAKLTSEEKKEYIISCNKAEKDKKELSDAMSILNDMRKKKEIIDEDFYNEMKLAIKNNPKIRKGFARIAEKEGKNVYKW